MDLSDSRSLSPLSQRDDNSPAEGQEQTAEKQVKKRTKTGCQTCRSRRIKCDEAKPECMKCVKSSRKCEGTLLPRKSQTYSVGYGVKREGAKSEMKKSR